MDSLALYLRLVNRELLIQFFKYLLVGGVAFTFDLGTLYFFKEFLGVHYLYSAAAGFLVGLVINYILSITFVFSNRTLTDKRMEFIIFALIGVVGLFLNEAIIYFFTGIIGLHYLNSKFIAAFLIYFFNFCARKIILFR